MKIKLIPFFLVLILSIACSNKNDNKIKDEPLKINSPIPNKFSDSIKFEKSLADVKNFDDLVKHFNTYKSIWISMGIKWDEINDGLNFLNKSEKDGFIKQIPEDEMLHFINDLPTDGDLRGIVFDLWQESKSLPIKSKK
jgi:uncharacterized FlaG/YvyC family protein